MTSPEITATTATPEHREESRPLDDERAVSPRPVPDLRFRGPRHRVSTRWWAGMVALVLLALPLSLTGCASDPTAGYAATTIYPRDIRTVAVPIFENPTFERDLEFLLTEALITEIESRTPYKVSGDVDADTVLLGRITAVDREQLSKSTRTGLSEEVVLEVTVDFEWQDLRTGRTLVARRDFTGTALFLPSPPVAEPIEIGEFAVVQSLARDIVDELQAPW